MSRNLGLRLAKIEAAHGIKLEHSAAFALARWRSPRPDKWGRLKGGEWAAELGNRLGWSNEPPLAALVYCDGRQDPEEVLAPKLAVHGSGRLQLLDRPEFQSGEWWSIYTVGGAAEARRAPTAAMRQWLSQADDFEQFVMLGVISPLQVSIYAHNLRHRLCKALRHRHESWQAADAAMPDRSAAPRFAIIKGSLSEAERLPRMFSLRSDEPCAVLVTESDWDGREPVMASPLGTFDEASGEALALLEATIGLGGSETGGAVVCCELEGVHV